MSPSPPTAWPERPAKRLFALTERPSQSSDGIVTAFRDGKVTLRQNRRTEGFTNAVAEIGYHGVRRGDLLIHSMDAFAGAIGVSDSDGKVSPVAHCYVPSWDADPRFYAYLLRTWAHNGFIESLAKGIRERSTSFDHQTFSSLQLPVPPSKTQTAIADYLDRETARIDALVAAKRRMIEVLETRRKEIIRFEMSRAGGMVDLKHAVRGFIDTAHKTAPEVAGGEYLVVRTANVKEGELLLTDAKFTDAAGFAEWTTRGIPRPGDIMLTREAPAGEACTVPPGPPLCIGQRMVLIRPDANRMLGEFGVYALYAPAAQDFIESVSRSSTVAHLNMSDIPNIPIPLPSVPDQLTIVTDLRRRSEAIRSLQLTLARQTQLLAERRQALIIAAVTGVLEILGVAVA